MSLEDIEGQLKKLLMEAQVEQKVYKTTGAAAISLATTVGTDYPNHPWKLKHIALTFSTAPTTSQSVTVTATPPHSSRPSTVLFSQNPSLTAATSIINTWEEEGLDMQSGDEVTLAFTNTDTNTIDAEIVVEIKNMSK